MKCVGSLLAMAAAACLLAWMGSVQLGNDDRLHASELAHLQDSDGDGLPDLLEMVLLSDPNRRNTNGPGRDDLEDFLDRTLPGLTGASPRARGNTIRVGVTTESLPGPSGNERVFWVHLAFRIQSGCLGELQAFGLFFQMGPLQVPLDQYFRDPRNRLRTRHLPSGALVGVLSVRISLGPFEITEPFQFLAGSLIGCTPRLSAAYLFPEAGQQYLHLLPLAANASFFSGLDPLSTGNQLWHANQICVTEMGVIGFSGNTVVYEVVAASCKTFNGVRCPPTCVDRKGTVVVAPDGWGLIEGG